MPVIEVPSRYRIPTRGESRIEVGDGTVRECIEAAEAKYPGFQELVLDSAGNLHRFVQLFVNGDGVLTPADAAIALKMAVCGEYAHVADVNDDRSVTSLDALMIMQAAAGNITFGR